MIMVSIESLVISLMPAPSILTLKPNEHRDGIPEDQILPIWIGSMESTAIAAALEDKNTERPLTHQLALDLVSSVGGSISRVVIDRVEGTVFFATIYVRCPNGMFTRVDARPSDAIALAIRANVPLFVEEDVFRAAACPRSFTPGQDERIELEEFDKFIEHVEPEDFVSHENPDNG
ncbi:MAG: bifunctional nuclease family protein [Coriobacteriales bacterium]|jgi:bifunctional DNase/RNase